MIVIKLWGGMCNQMFQIAFGYALSKKVDDSLLFDDAFYKHQPSYVTRRKIISNEIFPNLGSIQIYKRSWLISLVENKLFSSLMRYRYGLNAKINHTLLFIEKFRKYHHNIPYYPNAINFYDGYWQTAKYFEDLSQEIRKIFTPNESIWNRCIEWKNSVRGENLVAIHIRRGDIMQNSKNQNDYSTSYLNYYNKSIDYIKSNVENPVFCFFSDDIEWCKINFTHVDNKIYVNNIGEHADVVDLFCISLCKHGIMSRSTFSWWGNWLRTDQSGITICRDIVGCNEFFVQPNWIEIQ